jgi:hypothetical protein
MSSSCGARLDSYTQAVPGTLYMSLYPLLDHLDILLAVLEIVSDIRLVAVEDVLFWSLARFRVEDAPATMLQTCTQVARQGVALRSL